MGLMCHPGSAYTHYSLRSSDFDSLELAESRFCSLREPCLPMRGLINLERVRNKFPYSLPRLFPDKNPVFILFMTIKSISQTRRPRRIDHPGRRSKFTWKYSSET